MEKRWRWWRRRRSTTSLIKVNNTKGVASCYSFTVQYPFRFEPLRITISCCCNLFSMRLIVERDKFNWFASSIWVIFGFILMSCMISGSLGPSGSFILNPIFISFLYMMTFNSVSPPINTGGFKPHSSIDLMILGMPRPSFQCILDSAMHRQLLHF